MRAQFLRSLSSLAHRLDGARGDAAHLAVLVRDLRWAARLYGLRSVERAAERAESVLDASITLPPLNACGQYADVMDELIESCRSVEAPKQPRPEQRRVG